MAWSSPRTWVVGELVTATQLNQHLRDNLSYLLTAVSSASYRYAGTWAAGTYNEGDIVVRDGITYLCIKDNVTSTPAPW